MRVRAWVHFLLLVDWSACLPSAAACQRLPGIHQVLPCPETQTHHRCAPHPPLLKSPALPSPPPPAGPPPSLPLLLQALCSWPLASTGWMQGACWVGAWMRTLCARPPPAARRGACARSSVRTPCEWLGGREAGALGGFGAAAWLQLPAYPACLPLACCLPAACLLLACCLPATSLLTAYSPPALSSLLVQPHHPAALRRAPARHAHRRLGPRQARDRWVLSRLPPLAATAALPPAPASAAWARQRRCCQCRLGCHPATQLFPSVSVQRFRW